ncbi:SDR family oxidoreductase [Baekduia sp. Peel2402]|uniref:SDR family oxidoreductase n=1 Tax=Baekduia sp. Peel2402 TaxID=3458296 RepID=UPI00403ECF5F
MTAQPTLVLGATGKTGRRVAALLEQRGVPVRAASRSVGTPFDWTDPSTWAPALRGARAAYVSFFPDLAVPGAPEAVGALAALAVREGLERLVLLSGRGEEEAQRAEERVRTAGVPTTVVRSAWFAQNFSEAFLSDPVNAGAVALPVGDVREPFVDADDLAAVAVAALTEDGHAGEVYDCTGPEAITFAEAVAAIATARDQSITYTLVGLDTWTAELRAAGLDDDTVGLLSYLFGEVLDGRNTATGDGVQRALGRPPRTFAEYARDAAAAGAWTHA